MAGTSFEQVWARLQRGEISPQHALSLAASPEVVAALSPEQALDISEQCHAASQQGGWRAAVQLHGLLRATVGAAPDHAPQRRLRSIVDTHWIEIVSIALSEVPDGRLYRSALEVGDAASKRLREDRTEEGRDLLGGVLHALGVLHLDPYTAERNSVQYEFEMSMWQGRLRRELGDEIRFIAPELLEVPTPGEALALAADYFRQASEVRTGARRGRSLKAMVQALVWQQVAGVNADRTRVVPLAREALSLLDPVVDVDHRLFLLQTLQRLGEPVEVSEIDPFLETSLDEYVAKWGGARTASLVNTLIALVESADPARAMDVVRRARPLFARHADDSLRTFYWQAELRLIVGAGAPELEEEDSTPSRSVDLLDSAGALLEQADDQGWDRVRVFAGLVALARDCPDTNEEASGLELLEHAAEVAPLAAADHEEALAMLRAYLHVGVGVNALEAGNVAGAIEAYAAGLKEHLRLNLDGHALQILDRLADLSSRRDEGVTSQLTSALLSLAVRLETRLGEAGTARVQAICKRSMDTSGREGINPVLPLLLRQLAKGRRFALRLAAGTHRWKEDEYGAELLEQIRQLEAELDEDPGTSESQGVIDQYYLLTAYTRRTEAEDGESPSALLRNLRHRYDAHLSERLAAVPVVGEDEIYLVDADVQASLDARTVLVDYYLGAHDGNIAVYLQLFTRDEVYHAVVISSFPDSTLQLDEGGGAVEAHPYALLVSSLREHVVAEPGAFDVSPEGAHDCESEYRTYLGAIAEPLKRLRASGKDHLCVVPHGPLHYLPFHLLGESRKPLATDWIVTYLPSLHLLVSQRGKPAPRRHREHTVTSIGLSFGGFNPFGLAPINRALDEARRVAEIFGVEPVVEEAATEEAVRSALQNSRYIHLSTHGRHQVDAPAFQCLYLAPSDTSDGRLYAHELLDLDLRDLELISLSACETALGRFDSGDNLRGLPASLLLAGASTLIGTLWPVDAAASELFFTTLYSRLKGGATRLTAFSEAQKETRRSFSAYRDWGAFYLAGDWA